MQEHAAQSSRVLFPPSPFCSVKSYPNYSEAGTWDLGYHCTSVRAWQRFHAKTGKPRRPEETGPADIHLIKQAGTQSNPSNPNQGPRDFGQRKRQGIRTKFSEASHREMDLLETDKSMESQT